MYDKYVYVPIIIIYVCACNSYNISFIRTIFSILGWILFWKYAKINATICQITFCISIDMAKVKLN